MNVALTNLPSSPKAAKDAGVAYYYTGRSCKRGHLTYRYTSTAQCAGCQKQHQQDRYAADPEAFKGASRKAARKDYHANKDARRERHRQWKEKNPDYWTVRNWTHAEELRAARRKWNSENRALKAYLWAKYMYAKRRATPPWLNSDQETQIKAFYVEAHRLTTETGVEHHVDHIVPLQGKDVCGLHVPWNLQVLTCQDNSSKGNKLIRS